MIYEELILHLEVLILQRTVSDRMKWKHEIQVKRSKYEMYYVIALYFKL